MTSINQSAPTEIVGKITCRHAVKTTYPFSELAAVGIDVLYMIDLGDYPNPYGQVDGAMDDDHFPSSGTKCLAAVGAENASLARMGKIGQVRFSHSG